MGNVEAMALIVGVVMPLIVTLVKQSGLDRRWNQLIAIVACALAGAGTAWATGQFTGTTVVAAIAIVLATAQVNYNLLWRDTKTEEVLNLVTSIKK